MKAAVITFPASNCDEDCVFALKKAGFSVDMLWHKDSPDLKDYHMVLLPGGFSYGDYLRCGAIASLSPVMQSVKQFAAEGGLVIGVCNGFQILCESGLLPGALAKNKSLTFVCRDTLLKVKNAKTTWTNDLKEGETVSIPIAHGDGRYVIDDAQYETMKAKGQILFTYVDEKGNESEAGNPNGSVHNIAGVMNERGNVFGMMPHPDRATTLRSNDGQRIWTSIIRQLNGTQA